MNDSEQMSFDEWARTARAAHSTPSARAHGTVCLGLALVLGVACAKPPEAATSTPALEAGRSWTKVAPSAERLPLEAPARVVGAPTSRSVIVAPLRATVTRIRVRPGDAVDAGAPLVDVTMPEVLDAAARFEGAKARLEAWAARHQQLAELKAEGLARAADVSEAAAKVAEVKADLQAARAVLIVAGVREGDAAALLHGGGSLSLRAQQSGTVTEVSATMGETREPASEPLVRLASPGAVRVEARFSKPPPDGTWSFVINGAQAPVRLATRAPAADVRDGTFVAWFDFETEVAVSAGLLGRVEFRGPESSDVFKVPASSPRTADGRSELTVLRDGRELTVDVKVIRCLGAVCVVQGAILPTDEVHEEPAP
jgi:biotin carboxyl carrier protein